jgi:benzaldehyde dehydrogenase (NAD)
VQVGGVGHEVPMPIVETSPEGAGDVVSAIVAHPSVRRVNFTGSTRVCRIIAVKAAENLEPCLLELRQGAVPACVLKWSAHGRSAQRTR